MSQQRAGAPFFWGQQNFNTEITRVELTQKQKNRNSSSVADSRSACLSPSARTQSQRLPARARTAAGRAEPLEPGPRPQEGAGGQKGTRWLWRQTVKALADYTGKLLRWKVPADGTVRLWKRLHLRFEKGESRMAWAAAARGTHAAGTRPQRRW